MKLLWLAVVAAFIIFTGVVYVVAGSLFTDTHTAYTNGNMKIPANGVQILQAGNSLSPGPENASLRVINIDPGYDFYGINETANGSVTLYNPTDHYVNSSDVYLTVKKMLPTGEHQQTANYKMVLYTHIHFDDNIAPGNYIKEFSYEVPKRIDGIGGSEDIVGFWTIDADLSVDNLTYRAVHIEYNVVPAVTYI